jgi:methionine-gamma-lyase
MKQKQLYHKRQIGAHQLSPQTLMMSYGYDPKLSEGAVKPPLFLSSTFVFATAEDGARFFDITSGRVRPGANEASGLVYSRFNNPNLEMLEDKIALLDGAEDALVFSSGMSAIGTTALAFLKPGMSVVMSKPIYGGTSSMFASLIPNLGIHVVPMTDGMDVAGITEALNEASRHGPLGMVLIETPANPTNTLIDIGLVAGQCQQHGMRDGHRPILVVDNTFLGPIYQPAISFGADLVAYSVTKYMAGHSDLVAGAVAGNAELVQTVRKMRGLLGTQLDPHSAWLIGRSLETLSLRMERANSSARMIAEFIRGQPIVADVNYLGFLEPDTAEAKLFARQCKSAGSTFSFTVKGGREQAFKVCNRFQLIKLAVSLGGTESLVCHPASTTHSGIPAKEREELGITEGTIRLSVGIEEPGDLLADIAQALAVV